MSGEKKVHRNKATKVLDIELEKRVLEEPGEELGTEEWTDEEKEAEIEDVED